MCPRKVNTKTHNILLIGWNDEAMVLLDFTTEQKTMEKPDRRKKAIEFVDFYTGGAHVKVDNCKRKALRKLTQWSQVVRM